MMIFKMNHLEVHCGEIEVHKDSTKTEKLGSKYKVIIAGTEDNMIEWGKINTRFKAEAKQLPCKIASRGS